MFNHQIDMGLIPPMVSVYFGVCLSLLGFTRSRKRFENLLFTGLCLLVTLRPGLFLLQRVVDDPGTLVWLERFVQSAYWLLPTIGVLFFSSILGVRRPGVERGSLFISASMATYALNPGYVVGIHTYSWGSMAMVSNAFALFLAYCVVTMGYIIYVVVHAVRGEHDVMEQLKHRYILWALGLGSLLLMLSILPLMGFDIYPASNFIFLPMGILSYGVMRYRILDMGTLFHLVVFRLIFGVLVLFPNIMLFPVFKPFVMEGSVFLSAPLLLLWYAGNHLYIVRLYPLLSRQVNRYQYQLRRAEGRFARDLLILRDTRSLVAEFSELVRSTLSFETAHFFFAAEDGSGLRDMDDHEMPLGPDTISWLGACEQLMDRHLLLVEWGPADEKIRQQLLAFLEAWDASCCMPLVQHGELIGLVMIGQNEERGPITPMEIGFLEKVSRYLSIALYNSRVYQAVTSLKDQLELRRQDLSREIYERGQAKKSVIRSEEHYRLLAENIQDVLVVVDTDSDAIRYISPSCHKVLGYTSAELEGENIWDFFAQERKSVLSQIPKRTSDESFLMDVSFFHKDGHRVWMEISCHYVSSEGGGVTELVGLARDISERRDAELEKDELHKKLRQAQKMESIGVLAGGIAHDFNNILMGILGYTQLAGLYLDGESGRAADIVSQIETAGLRAKELVSQILAFSRQSEQSRCAVDMSSLTREALGLIRATLPHGVRVETRFPKAPAMVMADPVQIHQIVLNLCTNACHALEGAGGEISVSVEIREVSGPEAHTLGLEPGIYVVLKVDDTGGGMDDETRRRIFDPYFTTKGAGKGTGMGLAVVHGIILSHNGTVVVESEKGRGSRFEVYLPETAAPGERARDTVSGEIPAGGRILFVDDEVMLVDLAREALSRMGFEVDAVTDPEEALAHFEANPKGYDAVVTDMTMPKMSGLRLAEQIREKHPGLPVILCTGFSNEIVGKDHEELGVSSVLFKPVPMKDLAQAIRDVQVVEKEACHG